MTQLLQNALYGTALILAVAALRRLLKARLVPEARLGLWAVCLFRLLTPAAPESVLSLWGLLSKPAPAPARTPQLYIPASAPGAPAPRPSAPAFSWEMALGLAWLAVGLILAVRYALSWRQTHRAVASAIPLGRDDPRYAPLPPFARLREGVMEGAPLTFGAVRPTVVLSPGLAGEELECVLAHEGVHAARRDNLWHYVTALALIVHWWNPAVWLMARLLRRDVELSCDRAALKKLGAEKRAQYAKTLVSMATVAEGPAFCQTFGRKAAEERIISIMKFKKTTILGAVLSLALVLAVSVAFASEPRRPDAYDSTKVNSSTALEGQTSGDHIVAVPNIDATRGIQSDFPEVDPDDVDLSLLKEQLAQKVADGEITQEEAGQRLAATEEMLEQARRGEVKLFMGTDRNGETFFYGSGVSTMYYKGEDGTLIPMNPDSTSSAYVLDDYTVKFPTFDPDGNSISADGGIVGTKSPDPVEDTPDNTSNAYALTGYDIEFPTSDPDGGFVGTVRTSSGLYDLCTARDCDISYDHCHIDGKVVRVYYEDPGLLCAHPDCDNGQPHEHDGVQYAGKAPEAYVVLHSEPVQQLLNQAKAQLEGHSRALGALDGPVPSAAPVGVPTPLNAPVPPSTSCGVAGCTETRYHAHNEGRAILLSDPCPVEGCAIIGNHIHGDVCYSCNGAGHSGGVCDGSCYTYNTSTHHSDGHH